MNGSGKWRAPRPVAVEECCVDIDIICQLAHQGVHDCVYDRVRGRVRGHARGHVHGRPCDRGRVRLQRAGFCLNVFDEIIFVILLIIITNFWQPYFQLNLLTLVNERKSS